MLVIKENKIREASMVYIVIHSVPGVHILKCAAAVFR